MSLICFCVYCVTGDTLVVVWANLDVCILWANLDVWILFSEVSVFHMFTYMHMYSLNIMHQLVF